MRTCQLVLSGTPITLILTPRRGGAKDRGGGRLLFSPRSCCGLTRSRPACGCPLKAALGFFCKRCLFCSLPLAHEGFPIKVTDSIIGILLSASKLWLSAHCWTVELYETVYALEVNAVNFERIKKLNGQYI